MLQIHEGVLPFPPACCGVAGRSDLNQGISLVLAKRGPNGFFKVDTNPVSSEVSSDCLANSGNIRRLDLFLFSLPAGIAGEDAREHRVAAAGAEHGTGSLGGPRDVFPGSDVMNHFQR